MAGPPNSPDRFAVLGCRECEALWVAEHYHQQDRVECPRCGHSRDPDLVKAQATADNWQVACEQRARLLARRAGELGAYIGTVDDYGRLEDEIDCTVPTTSLEQDAGYHAVFGDLVDERLDQWGEQRRAVLRDEADAYLERRFGTLDTDFQYNTDRTLDFETAGGSLTPSLNDGGDVRAAIHATADSAPADLWTTIATSNGFQDALVDAVRELCQGTTHADRAATLREAGVTAANGGLATVLAALDRPADDPAHQDALEVVAGIGQDGATDLGHLPIELITDGPLAALDAAALVPSVSVLLPEGFRDRRREQRETTLWLLCALGRVADVRVTMTGLVASWLRSEHRDELPASFSAQCIAGQDSRATSTRLRAAHDQLDPEGRAVEVLRTLAAEPAHTLSYHELVAQSPVSKSRISQLLGTLEELALVERYGPRTAKRVELLPLGTAYLDTLAADADRGQELDALFSETGSQPDRPCNPAHTRAGGDDPDDTADRDADGAGPYRTRWLSRPQHAAIAGTARNGGVTTVDAPLDATDAEQRRTRYASYDADRDELVLSNWVTSPLQHVVSTALTLSTPKVLQAALPPDRLDDLDLDPVATRYCRCIGGFPEEAETDPQVLLDNLVEWGQELAAMTTDLQHEEYADRDAFRGRIMQSAHGLAGSIVHLLDEAGVTIHRELLLAPGLDHDTLDSIRATLLHEAQIQSQYRDHTVYRQLYEQRPDKVRQAPLVDVDAADPFGEYIGSLTIRGPHASDLGQHLEGSLRSARKPTREDAPEIAVRLPIGTAGREAYAATISRLCSQKNLHSTREAVTLCRALAASPHAVADGLHWLEREDTPRDLRLDEVRYALAQLGPARLLPEAAPTVSAAVATLLQAAQPLTQTELAERADVSTRSLRKYVDVLAALDLVRETESGYRLALPFQVDDRSDRICPEPIKSQSTTATELLWDVADILLDEPMRLGNLDDPVGAAFAHPVDYDLLRRECPRINPWVRVARLLCGAPDAEDRVVQFGQVYKQMTLPEQPKSASGLAKRTGD
ncbi:IclR helix-turn-helix domain-containing protein [Halorientalis persicus]|uniref:IclR helix-turn-helix domain-containing protein n=1 Tax=Halorientalis persicus TaxID=1367881 RepID=A0A1H8VRR6_9EURY|nr:DUF5817 domain-containing protein [Halorientalis persicus]SEP18112.1 IclR helix-turn-helix domain-containing protein [Halorientalis persicus]